MSEENVGTIQDSVGISSDSTDADVRTSDPETVPNEGSEVDEILEALTARIVTGDKITPKLKIMIYGEPGTRKSTMLGTIPNNLVLDTEDGLAVWKNHPDFIDPSKVAALPYKSWRQLDTLTHYMQMETPPFDEVETFSMDTISDLHKKGLAEMTTQAYYAGRVTKQGGQRFNEYESETDDHTGNNEHIRRIVAALRDLPKNIVLNAHSRAVEQRDKSFKIYPDFSEKLAKTIAGMMDIVAYVEKKEIDGKICTVWWFDSDGSVMAKNRFGIPPQMIDPTWEQILKYVNK